MNKLYNFLFDRFKKLSPTLPYRVVLLTRYMGGCTYHIQGWSNYIGGWVDGEVCGYPNKDDAIKECDRLNFRPEIVVVYPKE